MKKQNAGFAKVAHGSQREALNSKLCALCGKLRILCVPALYAYAKQAYLFPDSITITMRRLLLTLALAVSLNAQAPAPAHPVSQPYAGDLSIFEYPERDERLQIQRVMTLLEIKKGSAVADLGAGSGWFSVRAAKRVGPSGKVFAEDINPQYLTYIQGRAAKENLPQITTILGSVNDPKLPPNSVDAVLMLKVYHELAHPRAVLAALLPSLKPGARLGIIDRNGSGSDHGLNRDVVEKEIAAAGFKLVAHYDFTKADGQDYFLIFTPTR